MAAAVAVILPQVASSGWSTALFLVLAGLAPVAFLISPAMVVLSTSSESFGLSHAMGVVLVSCAFAIGFAAGPEVGGRVPQGAGEATAWTIVAVSAAATAFALLPRRRTSAREADVGQSASGSIWGDSG
jgi:predicted MFS family arabinose efflux permease